MFVGHGKIMWTQRTIAYNYNFFGLRNNQPAHKKSSCLKFEIK
jgi:hypothetical protein